jgi:hypothetical protein
VLDVLGASTLFFAYHHTSGVSTRVALRGVSYLTAIVTLLGIDAVPTVSTSETAGPEAAPCGTTAFTWNKPDTAPGADAAYRIFMHREEVLGSSGPFAACTFG